MCSAELLAARRRSTSRPNSVAGEEESGRATHGDVDDAALRPCELRGLGIHVHGDAPVGPVSSHAFAESRRSIKATYESRLSAASRDAMSLLPEVTPVMGTRREGERATRS